MSDMAQVIIPKSDQLNADDLIAGPMTVKITAVTIRGGQEQPISISFEGDNGKPYKACKSMCRVMVTAWGPDSKKYAGRSMTLYRDPSVKWAGMEVGGIRISHMSDIENSVTMALTMTRANKRPYTVKPLTLDTERAAGSNLPPSAAIPPASAAGGPPDALLVKAREQAETGTVAYGAWFEGLSAAEQKRIGKRRHDELWTIAEKFDRETA